MLEPYGMMLSQNRNHQFAQLRLRKKDAQLRLDGIPNTLLSCSPLAPPRPPPVRPLEGVIGRDHTQHLRTRDAHVRHLRADR